MNWARPRQNEHEPQPLVPIEAVWYERARAGLTYQQIFAEPPGFQAEMFTAGLYVKEMERRRFVEALTEVLLPFLGAKRA